MKSKGMWLGVCSALLWTLALAMPAQAEDGTVRLATYNINYGNPALERVVAAIEQADADVVALQEINDESERVLRDAFEDTYPHMAFRADDWAGGYGYMSRFPLSEVHFLEPEHGPFGTYVADVDADGTVLHLANVHLHPNVPERGEDGIDFVARALGLENTRIREVDAILDAMPARDGAVRVIIGDLNTFRGMGTLRHLESHGFRDVFTDVLEDVSDVRTWQWTVRGHTWRFRLDYVFVEGERLPAVDAGVIQEERASDHLPVVVTLRTRTRS